MRSTSNQLKRDQPSSPTLHENGAASLLAGAWVETTAEQEAMAEIGLETAHRVQLRIVNAEPKQLADERM
jgi:hypothetical protein